jgi:ornithine cyclodeaminase
MRVIGESEIARALDYLSLIAALRDAFSSEITVPSRLNLSVPHPKADGTLLLMPAWLSDSKEPFIGIKVIAIFPANLARGIPSLTGSYLLLSGETGVPLALLDGGILTRWRTAAASALAARYLARPDSTRYLIVGAGALAPHFARAFSATLPIREIVIWNRTDTRANALAESLRAEGLQCRFEASLERAVREADVVTCITGSEAPLVRGAWLARGSHLDLVGGFKPNMREADDEAITRSRLFVDTEKAAKEAGDLLGPLKRGLLQADDIQGDLAGLCRKLVPGRRSADEITLFKSAGTAIEDLAAAILVWRRLQPA